MAARLPLHWQQELLKAVVRGSPKGTPVEVGLAHQYGTVLAALKDGELVFLVDSGKFFQQAKGVLADARLSIVDKPRVYADTHLMDRSPHLAQ